MKINEFNEKKWDTLQLIKRLIDVDGLSVEWKRRLNSKERFHEDTHEGQSEFASIMEIEKLNGLKTRVEKIKPIDLMMSFRYNPYEDYGKILYLDILQPRFDEIYNEYKKLSKVNKDISSEREPIKCPQPFVIRVEDREIWVNDYLIAKPHAVGTNFDFFEFVRMQPANTPIKKNDLSDYLKEKIGSKGFSKILNELGFKGEILKAFFPKRSKKGVITYRGDKIKKKDLEESGIKIELLIKELELANLKNNPK